MVQHIAELWSRIDALRVRVHLPAYVYADLCAGGRRDGDSGAASARPARGLAESLARSGPPGARYRILPAGVGMKAVHFAELRAAVIDVE